MWSEQRELAEDNEALYRLWIAKRKGNYSQFIRFEVLTVVTMKSIVFWNVTPHSLVEIH
jgi:hypothetical protein